MFLRTFLLVVAALILLQILFAVREAQQLRGELRKMEQETRRLQERNEAMQLELKALREDPITIENVLKEKGIYPEGEIILH